MWERQRDLVERWLEADFAGYFTKGLKKCHRAISKNWGPLPRYYYHALVQGQGTEGTVIPNAGSRCPSSPHLYPSVHPWTPAQF